MKAFIAYRSSGEDPLLVGPLLTSTKQAFEHRGVKVYSTFFDEAKIKSLSVSQIVDYTFDIIDSADFLFVVQTSDNKSEGMLIEVGYCLAKKVPIILAKKDIVTETYLPALASHAFIWSTIEDLAARITDLKL